MKDLATKKKRIINILKKSNKALSTEEIARKLQLLINETEIILMELEDQKIITLSIHNRGFGNERKVWTK